MDDSEKPTRMTYSAPKLFVHGSLSEMTGHVFWGDDFSGLGKGPKWSPKPFDGSADEWIRPLPPGYR